jgi:MFS family permease
MGSPKWWRDIHRGQWLAMLAAVLGWMFDGFEMGLYPVAARPALRELLGPVVSASDPAALDAAIGWWNAVLNALFLFGAATGGLVFGWIGDRIGRTRALTLSVLTYALFTGMGGLTSAVWQLAVVRFVSALGMGGEWSLGVALVMEVWPAATRPYLAAIIGMVGNLGYLLVAVVSMIITSNVADGSKSWRPLMYVGLAPAVLTFFIRLAVPESEKWKHAVAHAPKPRPAELFVPPLRGRTLLAIALIGVALLGTWGAVQWVPLWSEGMPGANPHARENTQICSAGGACVGTVLAALFAWRFGRRSVYFALCLLSLATTGWLFRTPQVYGPMFLFIVFCVGLASAAFYGWAPLYLPELFPTRIRATGQGISYNFGRIIAGIGTLLLTGGLMERFKSDYAASLGATSLVYVVGLVLIWFAPETRGQPLPD